MAFTPEGVQKWFRVLFPVAMGLTILPIAVWEFVVRRGQDYYVDGAIAAWISAILAGPVGIKLVRKSENGNGNGKAAPT